MVSQENTMNVGNDAAGYIPVEADFKFKHTDGELALDDNFAAQSFWKDVLIRYFKKISAVIGLILIIIITVFAIIGPGMNDFSYSEQSLTQKNFAPRVKGLEKLGIFDGSEGMKTTTGTKKINYYEEKGLDGLISGYFGGKVDMFMQRFLEVANGIPRLVIVTLLLLVLQPGMLTIIFALMLTEWVGMSRIARAEMLKLKEQEFVLASRTLGAGNFFIIFKEVLPNIIGPIITQVMFSIPTAIFTEAFLSFVGLGIPVPQCSLGSLISEGFNSFTTHPYQIIPPIVVMALLMLSFNLVADGLREALDPKLKEM